jgi:hypothetical protein
MLETEKRKRTVRIKALNRNATMAEEKGGLHKAGYPCKLEEEGPYKLGARVRIDDGQNEGYYGEVVGYTDKGRWVCVRCRWTEFEASVDIITGKISKYKMEELRALTGDVGLYDPR